MAIPKICCQFCGYSFSVEIRERMTDKGMTESYLSVDPEHNCNGGLVVRLDDGDRKEEK